MKNVLGLAIALSLGLVATLLNWRYLDRKSRETETVSFLIVKPDVKLRIGDTFQESHFDRVDIPADQVGRLKQTAVPFQRMDTIIGEKAIRAFDGGEIVLREDTKTPIDKLDLRADEQLAFVQVDVAFVPSLISPGDMVMFTVPISAAEVPAVPAGDPGAAGDAPVATGPLDTIGPFRVVSMGNRLGRSDVLRSSGAPVASENTIGIAVKMAGGKVDPAWSKLSERMRKSGFRQVGVLVDPKSKRSS